MSQGRLRRAIFVLAVLLLGQWGQAAAHCLRVLGGEAGHAVAVCGPDGLRNVVLGADGQPATTTPHEDACPGCPALVMPGPDAPGLPPLRVTWLPDAAPRPAGLPPAPSRAPPQQPRAPPTA